MFNIPRVHIAETGEMLNISRFQVAKTRGMLNIPRVHVAETGEMLNISRSKPLEPGEC